MGIFVLVLDFLALFSLFLRAGLVVGVGLLVGAFYPRAVMRY